MAYQTKFEAIRTQTRESDHTSMSSGHGIGDKIGVKPSTLSWWQASKVAGVVMDMLAIALSCTFFVYALAVKMHQNMPMESAQVKLLLKLSNLGPTIYPILFAAVVGRAFKSIAFWKLERGGRIESLDRLLGSMTIIQTVLTQAQMRSLSLLSLLLIAIWSLSPLGGQASLRIVASVVQANNTTRPFQYVNTSSNVLDGIYDGGDTASQFVPVNALFGAALVGASSGSSSSTGPIDTWGNTKIPWIENLDPSQANAEGWYSIPQLNSSDDFASLIGVPLSKVSDTTNLTTSFNIETSYWTLSCPVYRNLSDGLNATGYTDDAAQAKLSAEKAQFEDPTGTSVYNTSTFSDNLFLYSVNMHNYSEPWDSPVNTRPRHITYMEDNNGPALWVAANCTIRTTYVEVYMVCSSGSCTANEIRKSRKPCAPESWTSLDIAGTAFYWFSTHFVDALVGGHPIVATPYQNFIINPGDPFNISFAVPPVTVVSNSTFALRLGQLLNTYWMAMLAPTAVPKGLRNSNLTADTAGIGTLLPNTTATETRSALVLKCNTFWFVVLLLSSAITAFIGLCGLLAAIFRRGPDISFTISSLVKDSPFFDQTSVATTLSSTDRSRLMKDWYAKYGDVTPEDEVGYIAIGSGNVADLQAGRLYR
ncbi:hypothetical protein KCU67_g4434, partial [Aureobasidium melanogenum]